jgi:hypothetical protein
MMSRTGIIRKTRPGSVIFWGVLLAAGLLTLYFIQNDRRNTMPTVETSAGLLAGIPPIDRAAPKKTETATFSLG